MKIINFEKVKKIQKLSPIKIGKIESGKKTSTELLTEAFKILEKLG